MTKVKICGLTREEDIREINILKPDLTGFVFAKKSRRFLESERAKVLKSLLLPEIPSVGVFVDEDLKVIEKLVRDGVIDLIQLHGEEDEDYIRSLRLITDKPIIQAFKVKTEEDLKRAEGSIADHILLDSGAGSGRVFDWTILKKMERPFFLAGGLSPENVREAVDTLKPYGVDVSSGVETEGKKDPYKLKAFMEEVRK